MLWLVCVFLIGLISLTRVAPVAVASAGRQVGWGAQLRVMAEACDDAAKEGISCELIDLR